MFAARADDEIGVGNVRRIQKTAERIHIDIGKAEFALLHSLGNTLGRPHDLLSGPIVESHHQYQPVVVLGELFSLHQQPADIGLEPRLFPNHAHADIAFV